MASAPKLPLPAPFVLPLRAQDGTPLQFQDAGTFARALHIIDFEGRMPGNAILLRSAVIEEPFSSAALEGAVTTRVIARRMIEGGRPPMTADEQMVMNAYQAMAFIRAHRDAPFSVARILDVHRMLNEDTLEGAGGLREAGLEKRLQALCDFANAADNKAAFLHPIIRAIVLHFALIHDHPFHDGNESLGRALFLWCALQQGYGQLEYASISAAIVQAPEKYRAAFRHSQNGELTHFIAYHLDLVAQAIGDLLDDQAVKAKELNGFSTGTLEGKINPRQLAIVHAALKSPALVFGIGEHAALHKVTYLTARADLERLRKMRLLLRGKVGAKLVFRVPADLKARVTRLKKARS